MINVKTVIDQWEVKDLDGNSIISVAVVHNTEMGNNSVAGLQVICAGKTFNYEPLHTERWAYAAKKQVSRNTCLRIVHGWYMKTRSSNTTC